MFYWTSGKWSALLFIVLSPQPQKNNAFVPVHRAFQPSPFQLEASESWYSRCKESLKWQKHLGATDSLQGPTKPISRSWSSPGIRAQRSHLRPCNLTQFTFPSSSRGMWNPDNSYVGFIQSHSWCCLQQAINNRKTQQQGTRQWCGLDPLFCPEPPHGEYTLVHVTIRVWMWEKWWNTKD